VTGAAAAAGGDGASNGVWSPGVAANGTAGFPPALEDTTAETAGLGTTSTLLANGGAASPASAAAVFGAADGGTAGVRGGAEGCGADTPGAETAGFVLTSVG